MTDGYESLVKRASHLRLSAGTVAEGMRTGSFRSAFRGHGIEFSGVREYLRGDDIRTIDWNVTARMGKPFVKLFDEDRELIVFLVVDRSLSMDSAFSVRSRRDTANEAAALLAFAAEQNDSPLGAVFFDGAITFSVLPKSGRSRVMLILNKLDAAHEANGRTKGSVLASSLQGAAKLLKNRSLVVILSDFRVAGYEDELSRLAVKHDVVAVRITDPTDERLPRVGFAPFADSETGMVRRLSTNSSAFCREWALANRTRLERWQTMCKKRGVASLLLSTQADAAHVLADFFASREKKR